VVLQSGTVGYYYTPVIDIEAVSSGRFFFSATISGASVIDESSSIDSVYTAGVRLSGISPTDPGWVSGELSTDSNWDPTTGVFSFEAVENGRILAVGHPRYFQARVEFRGVAAQEPQLEKIGIEAGHQVVIPPLSSVDVYVKSIFSEHEVGRESSLIAWFVETRNEAQ